MASKSQDPQKCSLKFLDGTVYQDIRDLSPNAYHDIKMSLAQGTSADLIYYLKDKSKLLKHFNGHEAAKCLFKGMFSDVHLISSCPPGADPPACPHECSGAGRSLADKGKCRELIVKRSHDGWLPLQLFRNFYVPVPRFIVEVFVPDYGVSRKSLKRDVYDYENMLTPFWGKSRKSLQDRRFLPYINMALYMVDFFLPEFNLKSIYSKKFWDKLLRRKSHKKLADLQKYLKSVKTPEQLIPKEERFVLFDAVSGSLQTIFLQESMRGSEDVIPHKKMAFPFEVVASGAIPREMPKLMIEHILRTIEMFVEQLDRKARLKKVPDFRPIASWKIFPPIPCESFFAETGNLVVHRQNSGKVTVSLVDTHLLLESEGNLIYNWVEQRFWISLFLNLRFWVKRAMDTTQNDS